jgi:hypothetical protein
VTRATDDERRTRASTAAGRGLGGQRRQLPGEGNDKSRVYDPARESDNGTAPENPKSPESREADVFRD